MIQRVPESKDSLIAPYERAADRVDSYPAFAEYRYVLLDDPLLYGPTRYVWGYSDEDRVKIKSHYKWLCTATEAEILECAVSLAQEFHEFLHEKLYDLQNDVKYQLERTKDEPMIRDLRSVERVLYCAETALIQDDVKSAADFVYSAINDIAKCAYKYHDERKLKERLKWLEPLARIGERVRAGGKKSHVGTYGTPEDKKQRKAEYLAYIKELLKKSPQLKLTHARNMAAEHFNVSLRTIEKYVKKEDLT